MMTELGLARELSEGVNRMFVGMEAAGLSQPLLDEGSDSFRVTFLFEPGNRRLYDLLPAGSRLANVLAETGRVTTSEAMELLGRSRPATIRALQKLQHEGLLRWVGQSSRDPRAFWELVRN